MALRLGRLFASSLSLFPLPKEAGTTSSDAYDTQFSSIINGVISQIAQLPSIRVPRNLPSGAAKALFSLFGQFQLDQSGASSTHPALDTFRRMVDKHVFQAYGADNIIEIGPSLTRMASQPTMCARHSCSPNLDGRDRARAILAANIVANRPDHPHQQDLLARGNMQYGNPVWMCSNPGQHCQVQGRIIYSSFSLQDETPDTLVDIMRSHGASMAIVSIQLPIGLDYVDTFQETDTSAIWKKITVDGVEYAQCNPGFGDAGYVHNMAKLNKWMTGFKDQPLFAECLYQFGSAVCFRFTLIGDEVGCNSYPMIIRTMLDKYSFIEGDTVGIPAFLTSSSHFDRLVAFLTTHHDKYAANLFKAALERISVLTPAIVLGDDKYTDRWVLTTDQRISVAMAACTDVQKMMHRTALGQRYLDTVNTQLATSARRAEASMEPDLAGRVLAWARGEQSVTSARTIGDWFADQLDTRSAQTLAQTTHLPDYTQIDNGSSGRILPLPVQPVVVEAPPAAQLPAARQNFVPRRLGMPQLQDAWPMLGEAALINMVDLPDVRGARLIDAFDPEQNQRNAAAALNGLPVNNLTMVQQRAVNNWDWLVTTSLNMLIVGPAGTGKSTHARRIAPIGACVVVPTNELQAHWQAIYPGHAVFTLDEAIANIHMVQAAECILIDEIYQFPVGHIYTLCSLGIQVIGMGSPDQRRYNGPLGLPFAHNIIPVDRLVLCSTIRRYGADITRIVNNVAIDVYRREFGPAVPQGLQFTTNMPGVNNIQHMNVQRPGLHLTFHRANVPIFPGTITIDASQGTDNQNVYVHLFPGDEVAFAQNSYAFMLALTRCTQTITFTVPAGARNQSPLIQAMVNRGLRLNNLVRRGNNVFGSRFDAVSHGFTSLDDLDMHNDDLDLEPRSNKEHLEIVPTRFYMDRPIVVEDDDEDSNDTPTLHLITPGLEEALYALHPEPPQPADLTRDKTIIRFRKPDPKCRIRIPEWIQSLDLHEPTIYHHIGYPFSNTEVLASVMAVFDRYTKPQNVAIPNERAFMLADIMFDRWVAGLIDPKHSVVVPSVASMFANWFSKAKALRIAQVAAELPYIDSGRPMQNEYFLKCQCKPKFKAFGFCAECGQGILATNKLLNATICPLITQATKIMQSMFKPGVIYDSGYSAQQLDDAVRATGAHKVGKSMSIDLSQQDSSHVNVHRFFIAKVLTFLGFDDTIVSLYLMSRARRFCKGLTMLGLLFEVIERLFSGEPGTALFNYLMSTGTSVCTFDFSKFILFLGKGDDNSIVPPLKKLKLAINMVKETGVTQKIDVFNYLDFANRIFTTTGRSFMDPARALAKYTMRMSKRDNTENEFIAFQDFNLICNAQEHEEMTMAITEKHKLDYCYAHDIVSAVQSLSHPATYYANLRPSKRPVQYMPTIRMSGNRQVVFENLRDRCAPEAIAYIADVPVHDVINYVALIRLKTGIHPDVRSANRQSMFSDAFFMSGDEIRLAAAKFGIRRSGSDLSLKIEKNHVVVIRGKYAWREDAKLPMLYGSSTQVLAFGILAIVTAYSWERRSQISKAFKLRFEQVMASVQQFVLVYMKLLGPITFIITTMPALFCMFQLRNFWMSLYLWIICQFSIRALLLPFYFRSKKTETHKRVSAARIEHAAYGTNNSRSYKVDRVLIATCLLACAICFWLLAGRDVYVMWDLLCQAPEFIGSDNPSNLTFKIVFVLYNLYAFVKALIEANNALAGLPMMFLLGYLHSHRIFGWWQLLFFVQYAMHGFLAFTFAKIPWLYDLSYVVQFPITAFILGMIFYTLGLTCSQWTMNVYTPNVNRALWCLVAGIYYYRSVSWLRPYVEKWSEDGYETLYHWYASNSGVFADDPRFRHKFMPDIKWRGLWPKKTKLAPVNVEEYMDLCVRVVAQRRGKAGREFFRLCHPDKMPQFPRQCMIDLARMIGYGDQSTPESCK